MKNIYTIAVIVLAALIVFFFFLTRPKNGESAVKRDIPDIGSIQILNGCGTPGAAQIIADCLRKKRFDVKDQNNARDWNYKSTLVVSRIPDMSTARMVADSLGVKNIILLRNSNSFYDVTVFVGEDYQRIACAEKN